MLAVVVLAGACVGGDDADAGPPEVTTTEVQSNVRQGGTVTFAAEQEPVGFNINTSKDNLFWLQQVVEGVYPSVYRAHPDFSVHLDDELMKSAELTEDDPQTVVYKIEPAAVWSDETPIGVEDFKFLWESCNGADKTTDCASTTGYEDIESVTGSSDGKTVTVVFKKPFADWKSLFANLLPAHYVRAQPGGFNTGLDRPPTLSGGPFLIQGHTKGRDVTLVRNDNYWGRKANLDSVVFRFIPDAGAQPQALRDNLVDVIYPQPDADVVSQVEGIAGVTGKVGRGLQFEHLTFNTRNPFLGIVEVRRAIAMAVDRDEIVRRTVGQFATKAERLDNRVWLAGQVPHEAHGEDYAEPDVAGAGELLEKAGFAKGADGVYARDGKKLSLRLSTTSGNTVREQQAVLIRSQLAAAGIDIRIENSPAKDLFGTRLPAGDFDIANFAWVATPFVVSVSKAVYATGSQANYGGYSNAKVDELFVKATAEFDEDAYADLANKADEAMWDDLPNLPLYQKPTFIAYRDNLVNVGDNATTEGPLWNVGRWGLEAPAG